MSFFGKHRNEHREIEPHEKAEVETEHTRPGWVFQPDVDIFEHTDAYVIQADMPGASEETVELHLDKGVLTLDAGPAEPASETRPLHAEYRSGAYHRQFRVSEDIDPEGVKATMKHGVLELWLPKSAKHQARRIAVSAA